MRRHTLSARPTMPAIDHVVIGWDRPLRTFFVQVHRKRGNISPWLGCLFGELPTAGAAIAAAEPFALIPEGLQAALEQDRLSTAGEPDGPAQAALHRFLTEDHDGK